MLGTGVKEKVTKEGDVTFAHMTKLLKPYIESEKGNKVRIKPKIVIEVGYEEIQKSPTYSSGLALRFPRFLRIRFDRSPDGADDIDRVKRIFEICEESTLRTSGGKNIRNAHFCCCGNSQYMFNGWRALRQILPLW